MNWPWFSCAEWLRMLRNRPTQLDLTPYGYTKIGPHTWKRIEVFEDWEEIR